MSESLVERLLADFATFLGDYYRGLEAKDEHLRSGLSRAITLTTDPAFIEQAQVHIREAAARIEALTQWQDISSAPTFDELLVWRSPNNAAPESYGYRAIATLEDGEWYDDRGHAIEAPSLWMPLAAPPVNP